VGEWAAPAPEPEPEPAARQPKPEPAAAPPRRPPRSSAAPSAAPPVVRTAPAVIRDDAAEPVARPPGPRWGLWALGAVGVVTLTSVLGAVVSRSDGSGDRAERSSREPVEPPAEAAAAGPVWVPIAATPEAGFEMGSNDGDADEKPVHAVHLAAFEMTRTEVTVAQYRLCVQAGKCDAPKTGTYYNWGHDGRDDHPVNGVSWNDAKAYCEHAGGRLPTEEEWEYAARGREGRKYAWGNTPAPSCDVAVMDDGGNGCGHDSTWPVCSKPAGNTPEGLCDMSGNVWEWTASFYCPYASKNCAGEARVDRGGGWYNDDPSRLRGAVRSWFAPEIRWNSLGFRCARG